MVGKSIPHRILRATGYKAQLPRNPACELRCESPVLAHMPHAQPVTAREATRDEQGLFFTLSGTVRQSTVPELMGRDDRGTSAHDAMRQTGGIFYEKV